MNAIKSIRTRLGLSQTDLGAGIGVTQGNVYHYEVRGQTVPPDVAKKLIEFAATRGLVISYDHVYGAAELPPDDAPDQHPSAEPASALSQQ